MHMLLVKSANVTGPGDPWSRVSPGFGNIVVKLDRLGETG